MASMKPFLCPQPLRSAISATTKTASTTRRIVQTPIQTPAFHTTRTASSSTPTLQTPPKIAAIPEVPPPTPFVPDVPTFLKVIGRNLSQHASKIPDWETLFTLTSEQMRELGIEPPRSRKYLLRWRQKFREGHFGIGGDLQHVTDGEAALRVLEVDPVKDVTQGARKYVVNVPADKTSVKECSPDEMSRVYGYSVQGVSTIVGPFAIPVEGNRAGAKIVVTEGMWEDKRGRKIDGGERRQTEIRYKRRVAERREMRERGEIL
ncbi:IGR protein motif-domain-containing protein [Xylariaceae sp. FL0255]|nr:IGR protein motif-domain-containing protein [Xylariaceae sp. FL0255]